MNARINREYGEGPVVENGNKLAERELEQVAGGWRIAYVGLKRVSSPALHADAQDAAASDGPDA